MDPSSPDSGCQVLAPKSIKSIVRGVRSSTPIVIGYLPTAIAFGLLANNTGLSLWSALLLPRSQRA